MATIKIKDITQAFSKPDLRGKHVVLVAGKVFTANSGEGALKILRKVRERYPKDTPEVTYVPKATHLILWI